MRTLLWSASMLAVLHAEGPPVGSVEVATLPDVSTATHSDAEGHDTLFSAPFARSKAAGADQLKDAAAV
jgi:hypothetical protein